jgi:enamine deaminase RidA (YjgF/YER057c/UK114 family)
MLDGAVILNMLVFGSVGIAAATMQAMRRTLGEVCWPITWVEGGSCSGETLAGLQVFAVANSAVERIHVEGRTIGSVFDDGTARHCLLGGLFSSQKFASRGEQTKQLLEQVNANLAQAGFSLADTIRTWFFVDEILSWYGEFNRARTEVYSGIQFHTRSLPASTGIGGRNPAGAALTLGVWAMQPKNPSARATEVHSPLQCSATAYGSSFSRAMEYDAPAGRRLLLSGTASIAPEGKTLWQNDIRRQVQETMHIVEALARSRGGTLFELTRATAYCKRRADAAAFLEWCKVKDLLSLPIVLAQAEICRDDLLFELEAEASLRPTSLV